MKKKKIMIWHKMCLFKALPFSWLWLIMWWGGKATWLRTVELTFSDKSDKTFFFWWLGCILLAKKTSCSVPITLLRDRASLTSHGQHVPDVYSRQSSTLVTDREVQLTGETQSGATAPLQRRRLKWTYSIYTVIY